LTQNEDQNNYAKIVIMKFPRNSFAIFAIFVIVPLAGTRYCHSSESTYHPIFKGIIDSHEHFNVGGNIEQFLRTAAGLGIDKTVFLPTGTDCDHEDDEENMKPLLQLQKKYPNQIIAFCSANDEDPKAPDILENCLNAGGKGLKLINGHPDCYDAPLNSSIMKRLFAVAARHDVPVLIHISIYRLPKKAGDEFKELLNQFPSVRVQVAHFCSAIYDGVHLDICSDLLDRYPNVYADLSIGKGIERYFHYLQEDITPIKEFILKYQDRLTYGSDIILSDDEESSSSQWIRGRMLCDLSSLQENQVCCPVLSSTIDNAVPGFSLPPDVLQKIFVDNPKKILKIQ
jgi:predicted TIM-barrel fold metal-dependent hydrolase